MVKFETVGQVCGGFDPRGEPRLRRVDLARPAERPAWLPGPPDPGPTRTADFGVAPSLGPKVAGPAEERPALGSGLTIAPFDEAAVALARRPHEDLTDSDRLDLMDGSATGPDHLEGSAEAPAPHRVVEYAFDSAAAHGLWDDDAVEARSSTSFSGGPASVGSIALAASRAGR